MPELELIEPMTDSSWVAKTAFLGLLAALITIVGVWLFWTQFSEYPIFWLLPASLAALVWVIVAYEAYTWN